MAAVRVPKGELRLYGKPSTPRQKRQSVRQARAPPPNLPSRSVRCRGSLFSLRTRPPLARGPSEAPPCQPCPRGPSEAPPAQYG